MRQNLEEFGDKIANAMASNLNYNVLIEALANGDALIASEVITLFRLVKERNSDLEEDFKKWE